jgi:hypothetical protein
VTGFVGTYEYNITIGTKGPTFWFQWNAYTIPDTYSIFLPNGTLHHRILAGESKQCTNKNKCIIAASPGGCQGTFSSQKNKRELARPFGVSWVRLVVTGHCQATSWWAKVQCAGDKKAEEDDD